METEHWNLGKLVKEAVSVSIGTDIALYRIEFEMKKLPRRKYSLDGLVVANIKSILNVLEV